MGPLIDPSEERGVTGAHLVIEEVPIVRTATLPVVIDLSWAAPPGETTLGAAPHSFTTRSVTPRSSKPPRPPDQARG